MQYLVKKTKTKKELAHGLVGASVRRGEHLQQLAAASYLSLVLT